MATKKRILVVEDEDAIREVIALNLRMAGYDVAEAARAAMEKAESEEGAAS